MSASSYEEKPYATFALHEAELRKLAALARLHGVEVASPEKCSVLEIGCGNGMNVLPLAERYPESRFVGFDLSGAHIREAQMAAAQCHLTNVTFSQDDIGGFSCEAGEFDYVICHGVFSWISQKLQEKLLALCARALAPHGVAFVSYNVLPGWRQRGVLRDVLQTGALTKGQGSSPDEQLAAGMEFLELVTLARSKEGDTYGRYLSEGLTRLQGSHSSYVFHEYLETFNEPVLFSHFVERAQQQGLQWMCEAKALMMSSDDLGPKVTKYLEGLRGDVLAREQCLDVLRNRPFRESLMCHADKALQRDLRASVFKNLEFVTDYREQMNLPHSVVFKEIVSGRTVETPADDHARLLKALSSTPDGRMRFTDLSERAKGELVEHDERTIVGLLVTLWRSGFVHCAVPASRDERTSDERPLSSRIAQFQAVGEGAVTSLRHRSHDLSAQERLCVQLADGTRSVEEIEREVSRVSDEVTAKAALRRARELGFFYW